MPQCLKSVLDQSVKIINKIKGKALNTCLFKALCEEMGSEHTKLLFHTDVHWLSRGKVLTPLFELQEEVMLFLHPSDEQYDRVHDFQWLAKLTYLADIFSTLNNLNVALQGKTVTTFNVQDKVQATHLRMESWCGHLDCREFDSFPTPADFLLSAGEGVDRSTVALFKQHLQDLHSQLGIYFPELDASFEWIRNPFGDKTHIKQVNSKLSSREVDSHVDIASDGTLKTTFREEALTGFWLHIQPEHPELAGCALKLLMPFPTTYNCEVGFSTLIGLKIKQRSQSLKLPSFEPDIASLMAQKGQHHTSH